MKNRVLDKIIDLIAFKIAGTEFENHTFVVGGFVRDLLLKNERNDLDFVVDLPEGGIRLATFLYKQKVCYRPIIYKRFGTAMVLIKGNKIEFVMTRNESYEDKSRHPEVGYASLNEDAFRRDFTINSLYYNICNKKIYDITESGLPDLEHKIIRSTSNPDIIFHEDPLRILRAIRFAGRLNFTIEEKTLEGIINWRDYLQHISVERIKDEFLNMLLKKGFTHSLKLCFETGVIEYILPPLINKKAEALELMNKIESYPLDLTLRLSLLTIASDNLEAMEKAFVTLTVNKKLAKLVHNIASSVQHLLDFPQIEKINHFVYFNQENLPIALKILKISFPMFSQSDVIIEKLKLFETFDYPLNGNEIIRKLKLKDNTEKSFFTKEAKNIWIDEPNLSKKEILELLRKR